jgi:diguanylate cyclase (GGDEF)-like protein/PAS domain S-box-containing protein
MNLLDMRTVVISYGISNFICMIVMTVVWRQNRRKFAGLGFWLADFVMQFIALILLALRGSVPDFLSMSGTNAVVIGGTILLYIGLEHFTGKRGPQFHNYILLSVLILVHGYFVFFLPNLEARNILFSLVLLAICSQCAWLMLRRVEPENRVVTRGVGHILIVFCLVSVIRIAVDLAVHSGNDFFHSSVYDTLALLTYQMLYILLMLSLFLMVNHQLLTDLEGDIVARRQTEEALRDSEAHFREVFDNTAHGAFIIDVTEDGDFRVGDSNKAEEILTTIRREDVMGKLLADAFPPDIARALHANYSRGLAAGKSIAYEEEVNLPGAGQRFYYTTLAPVRDKSGRFYRIIGSTLEITDRKRIEEALRQSDEKFSKAFQSSPDAILITRLSDGKLAEVNEGFCRLTGYTREEALSSSSTALNLWFNPQDREKVVGELQKNQRILNYEFDFRTKSGGILNSLYSAEIIQLGNESYILSVSRDITERKQMEKALRESEQQHRLIVQAAMDGFWLTDAQGHFIQVNDAYCLMSGYSEQELLSRGISDLDVAETPEITTAHMQKVVAQGQDRFETRHRRKDGSLFDIEVSVQYRDGRFFAFLRDITEMKRTNEIVRLRLRLWEYAAQHSIDELTQYALDEIGKLTNSPVGFYHFVEIDQNTLSLQAWSTRTLAEFCKAEGRGLHYPISEAGVWVDCVYQRKPVIHNDYASLPNRKGMPEGHAAVVRELVVPTMREGKLVAILGVGNKPVDYDEKDVEFVSYIADVAWTIVEQKRANEQILQLNSRLEQLAMTDELTGLLNRRSFFNRGAEEIRRSLRYHSPLSLLMVDIDDFKVVNDTYGHDAGDRMLRCVADTFLHNIRDIDVLARLGGEEFGILLPNTDIADATKLAERLRLAIEKTSCAVQGHQSGVTVSVGVATRTKDVQSIDNLLKRADTAMYQAKDQGRNRVVLYS